jgi:hypothetical protein
MDETENKQPEEKPERSLRTPEGDAEDTPAEEAADTGSEDYEFEAPQGMEMDQKALDALKTIAKEQKWPKDVAQKVFDLGPKMLADWQQKQTEAAAEVHERWKDEAKADPEIGGAKFDATLDTARQALRQVGTPALVEVLNETGLGNHPEVIRLFAKIGSKIAEDSFVPSGKSPGGTRTFAERLYPSAPAKGA